MKIYRIRSCPAGRYPSPVPPRRAVIAPAAGGDIGAAFWAERERRPWAFDLFQLLRRVDAQDGQRYGLGRAPLPRYERLRLGQRPTLGFAAANITAIVPADGARKRRLDINGFGLFGPNGPLPLHLTEYVYQRRRQDKDPALAAFANLFHHRLITLFYRAWADAQHCVSFDRPDSRRFDHYAACLLGIGQPARRDGALDAQARYYMAGHLSRRTRGAEGLRSVIQHYFAVPAGVRENLFQWLPLPADSRLRLHPRHPNARLGKSSCLGLAAPDIQSRFAVDIGPLPWRQYRRFLPAGRGGALGQLGDWIRQYAGMELAWEARVILAREDYQGCVLGGGQPLGQGSWLGDNFSTAHRGDFIYRPDEQTAG
ncbi:type VI secretion system baseplate subunit TssG [Acerihabitans arboris]|uniref:Type VI secretion system baseplate subunit TssG n=1 Tax=Acerihabitans arboris TaxID=2691583 RepID=A0A845SN92_9GAMM|nr:type VI secretion system baseplate subunit TssG [Acerihabitans arboris]NDL64394.1 type VI secretion system baseplate subunit TssG [Acerihabitans arboris]